MRISNGYPGIKHTDYLVARASDLLTNPDEMTTDGKKIGLAFSSGGYRAAAYHIGVLRTLTFADNGEVTEDALLDANGEVRSITVGKDQWHSAISLESRTVILEAKYGPCTPITEENTLYITPQEKAD